MSTKQQKKKVYSKDSKFTQDQKKLWNTNQLAQDTKSLKMNVNVSPDRMKTR